MNFFALLPLCVFSFAIQALAADESIKVENRVMGGQYAFPGQFPYQVSIRNRTNDEYATGAIISNRWILTTASSVFSENTSSIFVVLGAHHKKNDGTPYNLSQIIVHPDFSYEDYFHGDIAVLKTDRKNAFNLRVLPILVGRRPVGGNVPVVLSGWGTLYRNGPYANYLKYLNTYTLTTVQCLAETDNDTTGVQDAILCTLLDEGHSPCTGDWGSPVVSRGRVVGLLTYTRWCGIGEPDGHTRVSSYVNWIFQNTGVIVV